METEFAPTFTLLSDTGAEVSLTDFRGKKIVLYFYPKADTPGCTAQACTVRDNFAVIAEKDIVVIGISPDEPAALAQFRAKYELPFILLSDPEHKMAEAYGAWGEKQMYGKATMGILRSHFAIDEEGRFIERALNVKPATTADLALKLIAL